MSGDFFELTSGINYRKFSGILQRFYSRRKFSLYALKMPEIFALRADVFRFTPFFSGSSLSKREKALLKTKII
jgi:hypothetical protein